MSFFSSLCLFYPGKPPRITVGELRQFSARLREVIPLEIVHQSVELKYGESISSDVETTVLMKEVYPNMWQYESFPWDHEKPEPRRESKPTFLDRLGRLLGRKQPEPERRKPESWNNLWPPLEQDGRSVYRAHLSFGYLADGVGNEFQASDPADDRSYICPDSASLSVNPFAPNTLADDEDRDIAGFLSFHFPGNGYFSWRKDPFETYWQQVRENPTLLPVRQLCRESFPVPPLPNLEEMKSDLGPLFMNHEEYRQGDWVVTVSESG